MQQIKTYSSGLRLVVEEMVGFTSVAFNIHVGIGALEEDDTNRGISHLIEHMLFKGTETRTAFQIANELKNIGAISNAYTGRDETVFYTRSVADYVENCVDILSDMLLNSKFDEKELKREKKVVVEEIKMYKDDPSSVCVEITDSSFYAGSPYATNIIGTKKSVLAITRQQILDYLAKNYIPENIVISFCGNITFEKAKELTEKYFQPLLNGESKPNTRSFVRNVYPDKPIAKVCYKDNSQSEVCISYPMVSSYSKEKYAAFLLNIVWGSGANMSSRLFQRIREKKGLVYQIYSTINHCEYGGDTSICFSTSTKNVPIALKEIKKEINKLIKYGITEEELKSAKTCIYTAELLRQENTNSVAISNSRELMHYGEIIGIKEYLRRINEVTLEDVNNIIKYIYDNNHFVISCVGKYDQRENKIDLLKEF